MTGTALDHILTFLIPLFLKGANNDEASARHAVTQLLGSYRTTTDQDLFLAAEIIAFGFATLDNLSRSVADPDISIGTRLRLRSNANALSRAAQRNRQTLERVQKQPADPVKLESDPPSLPTALQKVRDAIVEAAPSLAETLTNAGQTMSRQQRRFLMRKSEQARAARERDARKTARLAPRAPATA